MSSVLTAGAVGGIASLVVALSVVGGAAGEAQRIAGVVDAAALAAADALSGFATGEPCDRAARVADAQGAAAVRCEIAGLDAIVEVAGDFAGIPVAAVARAGPPPSAE